MDEQKFKIQVISDLKVIKNELGHVTKSLNQKINANRWLIGIIIIIYIPLIINLVSGSTK